MWMAPYADVSRTVVASHTQPMSLVARVKAARNIISSGGKYYPTHERTKVPWEGGGERERAFEEDAAWSRYPILSTRMI